MAARSATSGNGPTFRPTVGDRGYPREQRSHDRSGRGRRQLLRIALVFSSASKLATAPVTRRSRGSRARGACQSSRRSRGCLGPGAFAPDAASASRWWLLRLRRSTAAAIGETMLVTNEAVLRCQCGEVLPAPSLAGIRHKGFDSGASRHGSRLRPGESRSPRPLKPWLRVEPSEDVSSLGEQRFGILAPVLCQYPRRTLGSVCESIPPRCVGRCGAAATSLLANRSARIQPPRIQGVSGRSRRRRMAAPGS